MVWGALGALIFSVYLVYDTQVSGLKTVHTYPLFNQPQIFNSMHINISNTGQIDQP